MSLFPGVYAGISFIGFRFIRGGLTGYALHSAQTLIVKIPEFAVFVDLHIGLGKIILDIVRIKIGFKGKITAARYCK